MAGDNKNGNKSLVIFICILIAVITTYVILHLSIKGGLNERISDEDIINITSIIEGENIALNEILADTIIKADSAKNLKILYQDNVKKKISNYLSAKYNLKIKDSVEVYRLLDDKSLEEMKALFPNIIIPIKSFFWLSNEKKFIEVIFWSLFGVLCSILYFISFYVLSGDFKEINLIDYWAKLFYGPILALVLMFIGYKQFFSSATITIDDTSYGWLFLSFVLGFFSGRVIDFLNNLKEILIPASIKTPPPTQAYSIEGTASIPELESNGEKDYDPTKIKITISDKKAFSDTKNPDKDGNYKFDVPKEDTYIIDAEYLEYKPESGKQCEVTKNNPNLKEQDIILKKKS